MVIIHQQLYILSMVNATRYRYKNKYKQNNIEIYNNKSLTLSFGDMIINSTYMGSVQY